MNFQNTVMNSVRSSTRSGGIGLSITSIRRASAISKKGPGSKLEGHEDDLATQDDKILARKAQEAEINAKPKKTQAQLDEELMKKLAGISGEGGASGVEYEDGKPVAMKRGVKNNMFRLI